MVWVEIDRCVTDAIQAVTDCRLGRRTMKYLDFGKTAATFLNTDTNLAVRVAVLEESRQAAREFAPDAASEKEAQLIAYRAMSSKELFSVEPVIVEVPDWDRPGKPLSRITCESCGEGVNDKREVLEDGRYQCISCAYGAYYVPLGGSTTSYSSDAGANVA